MKQNRNEKLQEFEEFIKFRKVAVIGLGVSNIPLIDYLHKKKARVIIFDEKEEEKVPEDIMKKLVDYQFEYYLGKDCLSNLKNIKNLVLIFRSPSCLPTRTELIEKEKEGTIITTEIEMLMKMCPCPIIGVTGSEGKTTTTSIIYKILKEGGYKAYLGGNIGRPLFTKLNEIKTENVVVLELSSFQLMGMDISPQTSVITNITPNHLNIHKNYKEYIDAKKNIFKHQNENGVLIINHDNEITRKMKDEAKGDVVFFSSKKRLEDGYIVENNEVKECKDGLRKYLLNGDEISLKGTHNLENICAAIAATKGFVKTETAVKAIKKFKGVAHRLEYVKQINGAKWYNDSASSSPTRTIAGINAFRDKNILLIAGGSDKNLDYTPLAKPIIDNVRELILLGQTSDKIKTAVEKEMRNELSAIGIHKCKDLKQCVMVAKKLANKGDIVLFSPASASFDMFKNAYERGTIFKELVNNL